MMLGWGTLRLKLSHLDTELTFFITSLCVPYFTKPDSSPLREGPAQYPVVWWRRQKGVAPNLPHPADLATRWYRGQVEVPSSPSPGFPHYSLGN